jgi:hypothetical protein
MKPQKIRLKVPEVKVTLGGIDEVIEFDGRSGPANSCVSNKLISQFRAIQNTYNNLVCYCIGADRTIKINPCWLNYRSVPNCMITTAPLLSVYNYKDPNNRWAPRYGSTAFKQLCELIEKGFTREVYVTTPAFEQLKDNGFVEGEQSSIASACWAEEIVNGKVTEKGLEHYRKTMRKNMRFFKSENTKIDLL